MQGVLYLGPSWDYGGPPPIQLNDVPLVLHRAIRTSNSRTYTFEVPSILNLVDGNNTHGISIPGFVVGMVREWGESGLGTNILNETGYGQGCSLRWRLNFFHADQPWRGIVGLWRAPTKA